MWLNKKKWNELELRVAVLEAKIKALTGIHESNGDYKANKTIEMYYSNPNQDWVPDFHYHHEESIASTDKIPNLTLQELAQYVIDGEPIERKCKKSVWIKFENGALLEVKDEKGE